MLLVGRDVKFTLIDSPEKNYKAITDQQFKEWVAAPPKCGHDNIPWVIPSSYNRYDAREHATQRKLGKFHYVVLDIDKGGPDKATVQAALAPLGCEYILHSSRSATAEVPRWHIFLRLATPCPGGLYNATVAAIAIHLTNISGIEFDPCTKREGQIIFGPALVTEFYDYVIHPGEPLALPEEVEKEVISLQWAYTQALHRSQRNPSKSAGEIGAFNKQFSVREMLERLGFVGRGMDFHHPNQTTNSYATRIFNEGTEDEYWHTRSQTVAGFGWGKKSADGTTATGDAYSLFRDGLCEGNEQRALDEWRAFQLGAPLGDPGNTLAEFAELGAAIYNGLIRIGNALGPAGRATALKLSDKPLDFKEPPVAHRSYQWSIEWPDVHLSELAKYLFAASRRPVKQFAYANALWAMAAMCGGRYYANNSGLNLYFFMAGGTGTGKGSSHAPLVPLLLESVRRTNSDMTKFAEVFNTGMPASAQGLHRLFEDTPFKSIGAYNEEGGSSLVASMIPTATGVESALGVKITELWQKSGPNGIVGSSSKADQRESYQVLEGPALTIMLDTQIESFQEFLGSNAIRNGLGQRFLYPVYEGPQFFSNRRPLREMPEPIINRLAVIWQYTCSLQSLVEVKMSEIVLNALYDIEDEVIVSADCPSKVLLNRYHHNIQRVAALMAVYENHIEPVMTLDHLAAAKLVVTELYAPARATLDKGYAGEGSSVREAAMLKVLRSYPGIPDKSRRKTYRVPTVLSPHDDLITKNYIVRRLRHNPKFADIGTLDTRALIDKTIKALVEDGVLTPVTPHDLAATRAIVLPANMVSPVYMVTAGLAT